MNTKNISLITVLFSLLIAISGNCFSQNFIGEPFTIQADDGTQVILQQQTVEFSKEFKEHLISRELVFLSYGVYYSDILIGTINEILDKSDKKEYSAETLTLKKLKEYENVTTYSIVMNEDPFTFWLDKKENKYHGSFERIGRAKISNKDNHEEAKKGYNIAKDMFLSYVVQGLADYKTGIEQDIAEGSYNYNDLNFDSTASLYYISYFDSELADGLFAESDMLEQYNKRASIAALKKAVGKLNINMTKNEVYELLGDPLPIHSAVSSVDIGSLYSFGYDQSLRLNYFEDKLYAVRNKDYFDLLSTEYIAIAANCSLFIDGNEPINSNTVFTINGKVYVSIEDLAEQLGVKVTQNEEKQKDEFVTTEVAWVIEAVGKLNKGMTENEVVQYIGEPTYKVNTDNTIYYSRDRITLILSFFNNKLSNVEAGAGSDLLSKELKIAKVVSSPVFINEEELLTSNPIIIINDKIYIPIEDLAEQLGIKVIFNEEKQQLEITTK